jgi:hypothetical protein
MEWIPWNWVESRHSDLPEEKITALFEAYHYLSNTLPINFLASRAFPADSNGCARCGYCCTCLRPGLVSSETIRKWREQDGLAAEFYKPVGRWRNSRYNCWYHGDVRLRICPLLFRNVRDGRTFCSIHHLGDRFRPPACVRYRSCPPDCRQTRRCEYTVEILMRDA